MFQFAHPEYLYALLLVPLLVALFIYSQWRNYKRQTQWGSKNMFLRLVNGLSIYRVITKFFLQLIALALLIFLLAQPQYGLSSGGSQASCQYSVLSPEVFLRGMQRGRRFHLWNGD